MINIGKSLILSLLMVLGCASGSLAASNPNLFIDVQGHWAETSIQEVYDRGLMQGIGTNDHGSRLFGPDAVVTRAQAATVMVQAFGLSRASDQGRPAMASEYYTDINDQAWFAEYVLICAANDVFPIHTTFNPDQTISRLETAAAIQKALTIKHYIPPSSGNTFQFRDIGSLSEQDLNTVVFISRAGIMNGQGNAFNPAGTLTRAELAQILLNCQALLERQVSVDHSYDGRQVTLKTGQSLVLTLPANATTGYEWLLSPDYDKQCVSIQENSYIVEKSGTQPLTGQGGHTYWVFVALEPGSTHLDFNYLRPWESVQPAQTFSLKVQVLAQATQPKISTRTIKENSDNINIDLQIPIVTGLPGSTKDSVLNACWEKEALDFKKEVASSLDEYVRNARENNFPVQPYEAVSRYAVGQNEAGLLSLYIDYYGYTGGAHGGTERRCYNILLDSGQEISLKGLFREGYDYKTRLDREIKKQIAAQPDIYFEGDMGFKEVKDDQRFYVSAGSLVLYFNEYEIAPHSTGIPEFKIPLSLLNDGLRIAT